MAHITGREIALETLLLITRDGEYSHIALKEVLDKYQYLEKRERAFITRVVNGTLERMLELDYIIDSFSNEAGYKRDIKKCDISDKVYGFRPDKRGLQ